MVQKSNGEGIEKDKEKEIELLQIAANKGIDSANERLAEIELTGTVARIDFSKAEQLLLKSDYFPDTSSYLWGRLYHQKSKAFLQSHFSLNWKELLKSNDVLTIVNRLKPVEQREYLNLINSAIAHYADYLYDNKDKTANQYQESLQYHKRQLLSVMP